VEGEDQNVALSWLVSSGRLARGMQISSPPSRCHELFLPLTSTQPATSRNQTAAHKIALALNKISNSSLATFSLPQHLPSKSATPYLQKRRNMLATKEKHDVSSSKPKSKKIPKKKGKGKGYKRKK
jgi:hypothetical protein